jgi:hypothetical protein
MNAAANLAEKILGHQNPEAVTADLANPSVDIEKFADKSVKMQALTWQGKNDVQMSTGSVLSMFFAFTDK